MNLDQIPLLAALKGKMAYTAQRQRLLAENVANADVPGYAPKDMKPYSFNQALQGNRPTDNVVVQRTAAAHIDVSSPSPVQVAATTSGAGPGNTPDSETQLDGNQVVLEEQMVKVSEARMDYDAVVGFYQQSMNMLHMAVQKPGG